MSDQVIVGFCVGVPFGLLLGIWLTNFAYAHSRLKKTRDEYDQDRAMIRAEFDKVRKRLM